MKPTFLKVGLFAVAVLSVPTAQAFNLRWLEDTPAQHFTPEDWQLLENTVKQALNTSSKGERLTWNNPKTGHFGSVSHLGPVDGAGRTCVRLGIHNETEKLSGSNVSRFCRQDDGSWKMEGK